MVEGRIKLDGKGGFSTTRMWTWTAGNTRLSVGKYEFGDGKVRPAIFITRRF